MTVTFADQSSCDPVAGEITYQLCYSDNTAEELEVRGYGQYATIFKQRQQQQQQQHIPAASWIVDQNDNNTEAKNHESTGLRARRDCFLSN